MKIGFDVSQTGKNKAGGGYLAYCLIRALADLDKENEYIQYPTFGDFYFDPEWKKNIQFVNRKNFLKGLGHLHLGDSKEFWNQPSTDFEDFLGNPDIIQSNNFYCPVGLRNARLVYVLYDLNFLQEPETTTESNRTGCFSGVFRASIYADHILSISEFSKQHFLRVFPHYPEDQISVVHLASRFPTMVDNAIPIEKPDGLLNLKKDRFWFNLGTLEPRKNQVGLLKAYAKLKQEVGAVIPLVIAGGEGWKLEYFHDEISKLGLEENVIMLGYINEDQLQWLYLNCYAFVYPSLFEGFGLPVLESMSQGAVVITSNVTSLPEVVGNAGILVDPRDPDAIAEAMYGLWTGALERELLKNQALERSSKFTWQKTAREVLDTYYQYFQM